MAMPAGFVDTHTAAIAVASLVASGTMTAADAVLPVLAALTTNTISKTVFAGSSGSQSFALHLIPNRILVVVAFYRRDPIRLRLANKARGAKPFTGHSLRRCG